MAAMEDVLGLYAEPYDPQRPVVCFDETSIPCNAQFPRDTDGWTARRLSFRRSLSD